MAVSLGTYCEMLERLRGAGYATAPVRRYFQGQGPPCVFLRHDVDRLPARAVRMARAEAALGVAATYYFRCDGAARFPARAVREVAGLGHEVGFHHESASRHRGDPERAAAAFERELAALRSLGPEVRTVAAHGAPLSPHANLGLAAHLDLERLGILGEAGADLDFSAVLYVTDSGGIYGSPHNRRDWVDGRNLRGPTTPRELVERLRPDREPLVLLSSHPERWPASRAGVALQGVLDGGANALKRLRAG